MADIAPFRGIRYRFQTAQTLQDVVAPPYDVITPEEQEALYQRHPANVVRLILGKEHPSDNDAQNRYTRAADFLHAWLREGILVRDKKPSFYLCRVEYTDPAGQFRTLMTLLCRVRLEPFGAGTFIPHEATLPNPKADRLRLLRATRAHFCPIFSLFSDPAYEFERLCAEHAARPPLATVQDREGACHRFWVVNDAAFAAALRAYFDGRALFIADGHHRFETALRYREEVRAENGNQPGPWDWALMSLANLESPGLLVRPVHRLVRGISLDRLQSLEERLRPLFQVEAASSLDALLSRMDAERQAGLHAFGLFWPPLGFRLLRLVEEAQAVALLKPDRPPAWRQLDTALLHTLLIERVLGVRTEEAMQTGQIGFSHDAAACVACVLAGEYQMAIWLNPMPPHAIYEAALAGETLPQKSTYFLPKPLSGLVMYSVEPEEAPPSLPKPRRRRRKP